MLQVECRNHQTGVGIVTQNHSLMRMDDTGVLPSVYIDQTKRTIIDGHPFFPMGMYFSTSYLNTSHPALRNISQSPFNFVMPYGEASVANMDAAHALGIKVAYSLKDL